MEPTPKNPVETALFPLKTEVVVRGYEIDVYGHVNNAVYLSYLEHARWQMQLSGRLQPAEPGVYSVLRHIALDYLTETLLGDTLSIVLWPRSVGTTSMVMGGAIRIVNTVSHDHRRGRIALTATQVVTCVKKGLGKTPVPDAWRQVFPANDPGPEVPADF